jgi:hypothetical protein
MCSGCLLHSMPEFGNCDRSNLKSILGTGRHPLLEVESAPFATNDNVRVEDYRHLSAGALRALRAAFRSRRHALASLPCKLILLNAPANWRPTQALSLSDTS